MTSINDLRERRAYVTDLITGVRSYPVHEESAATRDAFLACAESVLAEADKPLRVAVVGQFSAGKSLLLGVLVGRADLLPTSAAATTGNITELRFRQAAEDVRETQVSHAAEVRYFTPGAIADYQRALCAELKEKARAALDDGPALVELDDAVRATAGGGDRTALARWCEREEPRTADRALLKRIREWRRFNGALPFGTDLIGKRCEARWRDVQEALRFPSDPQDAGDAPDADTDADAGADAGAAGFLARRTLRATFPLIEKISVDLAVPRGVWDLGGVREHNSFVLLDFPGLGGGDYGVRDQFLCDSGLRDVHTILVVANSELPGADEYDRFHAILRQHGRSEATIARSQIYCAGRFDQLDWPEIPGEPERLTRAGLLSLQNPSPLAKVLDSAPAGMPDHALRCFSAVRALSVQQQDARARSKPGPRVPAELRLELREKHAARSAQAWRHIADRLDAGNSGRDLVTALRLYGADGGVQGLRDRIVQHVQDNGLALRVADLDNRLDKLDELKERLIREDAERETHFSVEQLAALDDARRLVNGTRAHLDAVRKMLPSMRDPDQLRVGGGATLYSAIEHKAVELVLAWPVWTAILEQVEAGVVKPRRRAAADGRRAAFRDELRRQMRGVPRASAPGRTGPDRTGRATGNSFPSSVEEFVPHFVQTGEALRDFTSEQATTALSGWIHDVHDRSAGLRRRRDALFVDAAEQKITEDADAFDAWIAVQSVLSLDAAGASILADHHRPPPSTTHGAIGTAEDDETALDATSVSAVPVERFFPLNRDHRLGWATDPLGSDRSRHVSQVFRMRTAMVTGVAEAALDHLASVLRDTQGQLLGLLPDNEEMPSGLVQNTIVTALAGLTEPHEASWPPLGEVLGSVRRPAETAIRGGY